MIRGGPIRVLLIDDSVVLRQMLARELNRCEDLHTFHCGSSITEVRAGLLRWHPEVIVLDLDLPRSHALELLGKLRVHYPVPVIVSARATVDGGASAIRATEQGAVEVVHKPDDRRRVAFEGWARGLAGRIRLVGGARPVPPLVLPGAAGGALQARAANPEQYIVALGASTGGTQAIAAFMARLPAEFPPVAIVQHMPPGFTRSFAERLNSLGAIRVSEAVDGEMLGPGRAVVARGDTHLVVRGLAGGWRVGCLQSERVNRHRPSVDVLYQSLTRWAPQVVGVLLTGMGGDGARGLAMLRKQGALTIAQDEASCVVYGMPKEAVKLGAVMCSAPPGEIPELILSRLNQQRERAGVGTGDRESGIRQ